MSLASSEAGRRLHLLFDWASAQDDRRRLALWIVVALALHAGAYTLFRLSYPVPRAARISDATLYVLLPGSRESSLVAPYLASADPALVAPEGRPNLKLSPPAIPAYKPSYATWTPVVSPLPDAQPRVVPPLVRVYAPVEVSDSYAPPPHQAAPARDTQIVFSPSLASRAPRNRPQLHFVTTRGEQLAPSQFLLAIAPDGRVLHVLKNGSGQALDDDASKYLMSLWFQRGNGSAIAWGTATFHWGLDVKREKSP